MPSFECAVPEGIAEVSQSAREKTLQGFRTRSDAGLSHPKRQLNDVPEQRVLHAGLLRFKTILLDEREHSLELPRRPDGSLRIMQKGFYQRLFSGDAELKICMESDISAAQMDLKHLNAAQLLTLRVSALDFSSESSRKAALSSFIAATETLFFQKVAQENWHPGSKPVQNVKDLAAVGRVMTLILGAAKLLKDGWEKNAKAHWEPSPQWLAACALTTGPRPLLFRTYEITVDLLDDTTDFAAETDKFLTVVCDKSTALGMIRTLQWDLSLVDPTCEDVITQMSCKREVAKKNLVSELSTDLRTRAKSQYQAQVAPVETRPDRRARTMPPNATPTVPMNPADTSTAPDARTSEADAFLPGNSFSQPPAESTNVTPQTQTMQRVATVTPPSSPTLDDAACVVDPSPAQSETPTTATPESDVRTPAPAVSPKPEKLHQSEPRRTGGTLPRTQSGLQSGTNSAVSSRRISGVSHNTGGPLNRIAPIRNTAASPIDRSSSALNKNAATSGRSIRTFPSTRSTDALPVRRDGKQDVSSSFRASALTPVKTTSSGTAARRQVAPPVGQSLRRQTTGSLQGVTVRPTNPGRAQQAASPVTSKESQLTTQARALRRQTTGSVQDTLQTALRPANPSVSQRVASSVTRKESQPQTKSQQGASNPWGGVQLKRVQG
mmetsp:Transcript_29590/g.78318  ORF Transcript_29590/g.78318 Transcript_29590/m.78318 type:complete len:666 (-) Transcript_29590:184-2181(-)